MTIRDNGGRPTQAADARRATGRRGAVPPLRWPAAAFVRRPDGGAPAIAVFPETPVGLQAPEPPATAVDILAAAPLVSATSLAAGLGTAVNNAAALLDAFCAAGIAVEVTHRSKRRRFGLAALAPLRTRVAPPYHPEPGRGRPPAIPEADLVTEPPPRPPLTQIERLAFNYGDIEHWMVQFNQTIRQTRPCFKP
jgi:hypothetical protein